MIFDYFLIIMTIIHFLTPFYTFTTNYLLSPSTIF